jgi:hypothetical protein
MVVLADGCNKNSVLEVPNGNDITIELDHSYIQFGSGIETKGTLINGYLNNSFAVLGYQYPGMWTAEYVFAEPNVFTTTPQVVTFDEDTQLYTYSPIQAWTGNRYSFFAYYPYDNVNYPNIKLFDNGTIKKGVPYITYTHPTDGDPTKLVDLMTASFIDTKIGYDENGNEINYEVNLEMQHRMSAIDICARNYYKDDEGNLLTIEITKLEFKPIVAYKKAKFYLDGVTEPITLEEGETGNLIYTLVTSSNPRPAWARSTVDIEDNNQNDTDLRYITSSDENTTILLIPQSSELDGTLELSYKMKYDDDTYVKNEQGEVIEKHVSYNLIDSKRALAEGRRYYVEITFTSDAVTVNITAADEWEELENDVVMEFE